MVASRARHAAPSASRKPCRNPGGRPGTYGLTNDVAHSYEDIDGGHHHDDAHFDDYAH